MHKRQVRKRLHVFGKTRAVSFAYGIVLGCLITAFVLNKESAVDVNTRWVKMPDFPLDGRIDLDNHQDTYYMIDEVNYNVEERVEERVVYDSLKMQLLQDGIEELIWRWEDSPLSKPQKYEADLCYRYTNESAEVKVNLLDVWKDETKHRQLAMVTQLAADKLPILEKLMHHWSGPISFALYGTAESLRGLPDTLLKTNSSLLFRDNIALHLVYQSGEFYPVNFLRNVALNNTDHNYVFLTDVDFIPSYGSYEYLLGLLDGGKLQPNQTLVVPAFEFPNEMDVPEFPRSKTDLYNLWKERKAIQFHARWPAGHRTTNYSLWFSTEQFYKVNYRFYYEPYIIIDRKGSPPYSQDFVGRHGNKVSHLLHVHMLGYEFTVIPSVFQIHHPHPYAKEGPDRNCSQVVLTAFKAKMNFKEPKNEDKITYRPKRKRIIRKVIRRIIRQKTS